MTEHPTNAEMREESPADIASRLERLSPEEGREILAGLANDRAAAALEELDPKEAAALLEEFPGDRIGDWLRYLPPNHAADLAAALPVEQREEVLRRLPPEHAAAVGALLRYPAESAGGIMDNRFIAVPASETVDECLARLRADSRYRTADISYIYVVDEARRLVGVVSLRELVFNSGGRQVSEIMNPDVRFLRVTDDQEEIAQQVQRHHYLGLPVVDEQDRLAGVVKLADAFRIAQTEATEDMQLMVGLSGEERIWTSWKQSIPKRLPWLAVNMVTALLAATIVNLFESTIASWAAVVVFLPLISAVAGNAGIQSLTVVIRALSLGEVEAGDACRAIRKELLIGMVNGFVLGVAIGLIGFGWKGSLLLGAVAGLAMLFNQIIGSLSGVVIPFGLRRCGIDPALASGIFVTTLTDMIGFFVFLGLAAMAIRAYGPQ